MEVTKITIPAGNEILKGKAITGNFKAYTFNLKQRLAYYKQWVKSYKANPCNTFKSCLAHARELALAELASFDRMEVNFKEYSEHPDFIIAKNVYLEIKRVLAQNY